MIFAFPFRLSLAALALLASAAPLAGQGERALPTPAVNAAASQRSLTPSYTTRQIVSEIRIDGMLDEAAWAEAEVIPLSYEWFPGDNVRPPVETRCHTVYDAENLYFACTAFDRAPSEIRANYTDRDAAFQDDHIIFVLDPFRDQRRAFQFRINPFGVQMDAIWAAQYEDFSWDAIWNSAGRITEEGYVVEVAIPFKSLRFPSTAEVQTWGFFIERSYPRKVRHRMITHARDRDNACLLCQLNALEGLQGISPGRDFEMSPTLTAGRTDALSQPGATRLTAGEAEAEPGLDLRWGITPNVSLNATVNPDFSQVEADAAQLDVNTRFALFFPEKRPFFLEGADLFKTMAPVVFTRTVQDPIAGAKASGKAGKNAFGVFATQDRTTSLLFPSNQGSRSAFLEEEVMTGVARYRRDMGESSTLGALYTVRAGDAYQNHVGSIDGSVRLSPTKALSFQYIHTETEYPDSVAAAYAQETGGFGGDAVIAQASHNGRGWNGFLQYQYVGAGVRGDAGFLPRVDVEVYRGQAERILWGRPGGWFTRLGLAVIAQRLEDTSGALTDQGVIVGASYMGPMQTTVDVDLGRRQELFRGTVHTLNEAVLGVGAQPNRVVSLGLAGRAGDAVDYANARKADQLQLRPSANLRLGRHFSVSLDHTFQRLSTEAGQQIFTANLSQVRTIYNFNARTFVRAIAQYRSVRREPEAYGAHLRAKVEPESRGLATQFLFSYKVNPQTVLFLGYSDNQRGGTDLDMLRTDRTFFAKVGYAWRL